MRLYDFENFEQVCNSNQNCGKWFLVTNSIYLRKIITNIVLKALWEISEYFFVDSLFFWLILMNLLREADFCQLEISKIAKYTAIAEIYNLNNQNVHCISISGHSLQCVLRDKFWTEVFFKYHTYPNCHIGKTFWRCNFFA